MKHLLKVLTVLILISMAGSALAAAKKAKKAPRAAKAKVAVKEMTLTGVVTKTEKKSKAGKVAVSYILTDAAGNKIALPKPRAKGEGAINLADFVDKNVTVVAKGTETKRGDKTNIRLSQVISIEAAGAEADVEVPMADEGGGDADF